MFGFCCEGETWGPRVRARAAARLGGLALAEGSPRPPLEGLPYRPVRWCEPAAFEGLDVVAGDWSCVAMRPPGCFGIAVTIQGQARIARYGEGRPPDALWDGEARPLHPWAADPPEARRTAQGLLSGAGRPILAVLDQSHTPGVLWGVCSEHADEGWQLARLSGWGADRLIAGADLLVCSAGWSQVLQARAARVPYVAVEQHGADQWTRAHCTLAELAGVVANLRPEPAPLAEGWQPELVDWLPSFASTFGITAPAGARA